MRSSPNLKKSIAILLLWACQSAVPAWCASPEEDDACRVNASQFGRSDSSSSKAMTCCARRFKAASRLVSRLSGSTKTLALAQDNLVCLRISDLKTGKSQDLAVAGSHSPVQEARGVALGDYNDNGRLRHMVYALDRSSDLISGFDIDLAGNIGAAVSFQLTRGVEIQAWMVEQRSGKLIVLNRKDARILIISPGFDAALDPKRHAQLHRILEPGTSSVLSLGFSAVQNRLYVLTPVGNLRAFDWTAVLRGGVAPLAPFLEIPLPGIEGRDQIRILEDPLNGSVAIEVSASQSGGRDSVEPILFVLKEPSATPSPSPSPTAPN